MLDLGATEFHLDVPSVAPRELEFLSTLVFDEWDKYIDLTLSLPDYSLFLEVEEGSISGRGFVAAGLATIYIGLGNYGDFIQGVRTVSEQLAASREYLAERAQAVFQCPSSGARSTSRSGTLSALNRLFVKVQNGEITSEEAIARAKTLLGNETAEAPGFLQELENALRGCPTRPVQLGLLAEAEDPPQVDGRGSNPNRDRSNRPKIAMAPPTHFRMEVWRESKKKRKHSRLTRV